MKKFMMMISAAMLCCSCMLDDGTESRHTADNLKQYASYSFQSVVLETAQRFNLLLQLDDYINASEEERLTERYEYIRNGLVRTSATTYRIYYSELTVDTRGRSIRDESADWDTNGLTFTMIEEGTWHISHIGQKEIDATITDAGVTDYGSHILEMSITASEEGGLHIISTPLATISSDLSYVTATFSTPDGPITLYSTYVEDGYTNVIDSLNAEGLFRVDIAAESKPLDWITMKFSTENKMTISYKTSLD